MWWTSGQPRSSLPTGASRPVLIIPLFVIVSAASGCNTSHEVSIADSASLFKKDLITAQEFRDRLARGGEPAIREIIPLLLNKKLRMHAMYSICLIEKYYSALRPMLWDSPIDESEESVKIFGTVADALSPESDSTRKYDVMQLVREGKLQEAVSLLQTLWSRKSG
jgi:hypothetical protein